jgi:hypothetical protein
VPIFDTVVIHHAEIRTELAQSVDLSRGCIRCVVRGNDFKVGHTVEVTFILDNRNALAVGQVTRAIRLTPLVQEIAIEFVELGDDTLASLQELGLASASTESEE